MTVSPMAVLSTGADNIDNAANVNASSPHKDPTLSPDTSSETFPSTSTVHLVFEKQLSDVEPTDKFRVDFLRKLSAEKVWVPKAERPPKHQTVIIFDWDDTLMYTSFILRGYTGRGISETTRQQLQTIEKAAYDLLHQATELGHAFIITNAEAGWVEDCIENYMPSLKEIIGRVGIISARSAHERECSHLSEWKQRAFLELGRKLPNVITNLVAIGDSNYEMEAVHLMGQEFKRSLIKTVKLQERPTPEELMKELDLVAPKLQKIVERGMNMKIRLERRAAKSA